MQSETYKKNIQKRSVQPKNKLTSSKKKKLVENIDKKITSLKQKISKMKKKFPNYYLYPSKADLNENNDNLEEEYSEKINNKNNSSGIKRTVNQPNRRSTRVKTVDDDLSEYFNEN